MKDFSLIETMLWENGEFFLLNFHMARLRKSASFFSFTFKEEDLIDSLARHSRAFDNAAKYRARLLLSKSGDAVISSEPLSPDTAGPARAALSPEKTDRNDIFLFHKTTNRALYDREYKKCREMGFFDVIFTNADGEVTEGAVTNIMVKKGDVYLTPPLSCGVLPGTYREYLLKTQEIPLKEKVLMKEDLDNADGIFLVNSVRGMVEVELSARP